MYDVSDMLGPLLRRILALYHSENVDPNTREGRCNRVHTIDIHVRRSYVARLLAYDFPDFTHRSLAEDSGEQ